MRSAPRPRTGSAPSPGQPGSSGASGPPRPDSSATPLAPRPRMLTLRDPFEIEPAPSMPPSSELFESYVQRVAPPVAPTGEQRTPAVGAAPAPPRTTTLLPPAKVPSALRVFAKPVVERAVAPPPVARSAPKGGTPPLARARRSHRALRRPARRGPP